MRPNLRKRMCRIMTKEEFWALLEEGTLLLDGATGSCLLERGMPRGTETHLWVLEHPEVLAALQRAYVRAGSRVLYTPTLQCQELSMKKSGRERHVEAVNAALTALTRQAAEPGVLVAGDLSTLAGEMDSWDEGHTDRMIEIYRRQIRGLLEGGADLLAAETLLYPAEAEAIAAAAELEGAGCVLYSFTMQPDGALFSGREAGPVLRELELAGAAAVGFNCVAAGPELPGLVSRLRRQVRGPLLAKPNAGLPVIGPEGRAVYPMGAEEFAGILADCRALGAQLLGGCCGTDPAFIRALKARLEAAK